MKTWINWLFTPTGVVSVFCFLLPWQTRYIFGLSLLSGSFTQFSTWSLYASVVWLVFGLTMSYFMHGLPVIERRYRSAVSWGSVIMLVTIVSGFLSQYSLSALAQVTDMAGAALAFVALLDKRIQLRSVMMAFVVGLLLPIALGVWQVIIGSSGASTWLGLAGRDAEHLGDAVLLAPDGTRVLRAYGSFPHPNNFGGYLSIGILSAVALRPYLPKRREMTAAFAIVIAILGVGLLLTASRSAILGLLLGGGLIALGQRLATSKAHAFKGYGLSAVLSSISCATIAAALLLTLFAPTLVESLRGGGELEQKSITERIEQYQDWSKTVHGIDWVIGNGPRSYVFNLATVYPHRGVWEFQPIHNVLLLLVSEIGLFGFVAVLGWSMTVDRINFSRLPRRDALFAFGMGNVLFVIAFFDHYLWTSWAGLALVAYVMALTVRLGAEDLAM